MAIHFSRQSLTTSICILIGVLIGPTLGISLNSSFTKGFAQMQQTTSVQNKALCIAGVVQIPASATNTKINIAAPPNNTAVTEFYVELTQANSKLGAAAIGGPSQVSGTYGIFAKLCVPNNPSGLQSLSTLQVLTHGGTLDHTYWDIAPGYSYVDEAAAAGYATLAYDRLGTGRSDHPDPVQIVQLPLHIEILHTLVAKIRNASLGGFAFRKIVGVGHSLGAAVTQGVAAKYPADFDALILQGTSTNFQYAFTGVASEDQQIASTQAGTFSRFRGLADGYHTPAQVPFALQFAFYRFPGFDPKIFEIQSSNKQTNALGETFTLAGAYAPATSYTGPVDIVNGQNDYFYCGGDCTYPSDQAVTALAAYFPAAAGGGKSQTFLAPGAGHNVNAHLSAGKAFAQMLAFLKGNGI